MKVSMRRILTLLASIAQWSFVALLALVTIGSAGTAFDRRTAGLDTTGFFIAIAVMAAVTILLSPPVFFRLSSKAKMGSYVLVLAAFVALIWTFSLVDLAYKRTPKGVQEARAAALQVERDRQYEERERQEEKRAGVQNEQKAVLSREAEAVWRSIQNSSDDCEARTTEVAKAAKGRDEYKLYVAAQAAERACEDASAKVESIAPPASAVGETRAKYVSAISSCATAFGLTAIGYRTLAKVVEGEVSTLEYRKWSEQGNAALSSCRTDYDQIIQLYGVP